MRLRGRPISRQERRLHHRLPGDGPGRARFGQVVVLVHQPGQEFLVERAPIDADAHRLVVADGGLDDRAKLPIALVLEADIAGIDAVFGERLGASGMIGEKLVADIMEVADERDVDAQAIQPLAHLRNGRGGFVAIDGDAHDFGAGARKRCDLGDRRIHIRRVGVGHRLNHDRGASADQDAAHIDPDRALAGQGIGDDVVFHGHVLHRLKLRAVTFAPRSIGMVRGPRIPKAIAPGVGKNRSSQSRPTR